MKALGYEEAVGVYRAALRTERHDQVRGSAETDSLGTLIDIASDLGRDYGLRRAVAWAERIIGREETSNIDRALVHYFAANAWAALREIRRRDAARLEWEQPESEREIAHLRYAKSVMTGALDSVRQCQILTNLGNALNARGRTVEAVAEWDAALAIDPSFAMAHGCRGSGLWWYTRLCYDPGHRTHLARAAHLALESALAQDDPSVHLEPREGFADLKTRIEKAVPSELLRATPQEFHGRKLDLEELVYREWCARERLFLNDLNDITSSERAMADVLTLPTFVTALNEGPSLIGFFNQLKQEYSTARWLMFAGTRDGEVHFADRDVTLVNTLDYPAYSIGVEQVKLAFRSAYSLFDKLAFFLNDYFRLGIGERDVSFRKLWYDNGEAKRGIRPELRALNNTALQALFWMSKDFFEQSMPVVQTTEPTARRLAAVRNELEHKYLKLHQMMVGLSEGRNPEPAHDRDRLAYSMSLREFEQETFALLRRARAGLFYLAFAIRLEEERRAKERNEKTITVPIVSDTWKDEWKR